MPSRKNFIFQGAAPQDANITAFNPQAPYTACIICGAILQRPRDRQHGNLLEKAIERREWARKHAHSHTEKQHMDLKVSGRLFTPEAAEVFAAYGIISVIDIVMDDEVKDAYAKAPRQHLKEVRDK